MLSSKKDLKFSIIIPAHNSDAFIDKALMSVYNQDYDYDQYEIIVVCDKCTDNTPAIAKEYTDKVIKVDYGRDGLARQAGIDIAKGQYILFMDDDDWWLHEYVLKTLDDYAAQLEHFDVLCFGFIWKSIGYTGPVRFLNGRKVLWPNVWSKMYNREWLIRSGVRFGDARMISDLHFSRALMAHDPETAYLDQPLYYYNYMRIGSQTEREGK